MAWPVIIKRGQHLNLTLAGVKFDRYGQHTGQTIILCDDWQQGFCAARDQGYQQALFVNSGTAILDWTAWKTLIDKYPHQGLIAHIIWPPEGSLTLDDQCWFMDLDRFEPGDFDHQQVSHPVGIRSDTNLHDDYTPLWIKPDISNTVTYQTSEFGQGLIAQQLCQNRTIVNWNNHARSLKLFAYQAQTDHILQASKDYIQLAEHQLWVLNNEKLVQATARQILQPGSGLCWIANMIQPSVEHIQIVDISRTQIDFVQQLWQQWSGTDYGSFAWEFIQQNQLKHYELDQANLSPVERLRLRSRSRFVEHVNTQFAQIMPDDFVSRWQQARANKTLHTACGNLVHWVLNNDIQHFDQIWCSNILDYKWTFLHTSVQDYERFLHQIS